MNKFKLLFFIVTSVFVSTTTMAEDKKVAVTLNNFNTVETHVQMDRYQTIIGGVNKWQHSREMVPIDKQTTIAMNRDTFYSFAVLNLSQPVTITMPEANGRYMALQVIDQDHFTPLVFEQPGTYQLTEENVGTTFAFVAVRTFVDPNDPADINAVHALQDAMTLEGGGDELLVFPNYDMDAYHALFADLQRLIKYWGGDTSGAMGKRGEVNELTHTVATAAGWGLNPPENAMYFVENANLDPNKKYKIVVPADVPVNGFWSISIYNKEGYFVENELDAYVLNNITGKKDQDGRTTIYLGACEDEKYNCLPLPGEGNYHQWRLYVPKQSVQDGEWHFPDAIEMK